MRSYSCLVQRRVCIAAVGIAAPLIVEGILNGVTLKYYPTKEGDDPSR